MGSTVIIAIASWMSCAKQVPLLTASRTMCVAESVCVVVYWRCVSAYADAQQAQKSILKCIGLTINSRAISRAMT